jgi:hypothetical protein
VKIGALNTILYFGAQMIFIRTFRISYPILVKFGIGDLRSMLLRIGSGKAIIFMDVNEITFIYVQWKRMSF